MPQPIRTPTLRVLAGAALVILLATGCEGDSLTPDPCSGPAAIVTPSAVHITLGDTIVADVRLVGPPHCRPPNLTRRQIRWTSTDSTVARVSPNKGIAVGRGVGEASIMAYYPADGSIWGTIPVTVGP